MFKCDECHEEFETEWTDEEAEAEYQERFGALATFDHMVVCDKCFDRMTRKFPIERFLREHN